MSALAQRISQEMKAALLGGDRFRGEVLRNLKAAILNEEVATGRREAGLDDAAIERVIAREVKKRRESAAVYRANNRPELAEPEEQEAAVLQQFLPEQLSSAALQEVIDQVIAEMGEVSGPQVGRVIGVVKAKVGSAADGALVAQLVKDTIAK